MSRAADCTRPALPALGPDASLNGSEPLAETVPPDDPQREGLLAAARSAAIGEVTVAMIHEARDPLAAARAGLSGAAADLPRVAKALRAAMRSLPASARAVLDDALGQYGAVTALREATAVVEEAAGALGRVEAALGSIQRLGAAPRGQAGRDRSLVQVNDIVRDAVRLVGGLVNRRARLLLDLQPLPVVEADPSALLHLLVEVLRNAAAAIEPGRPDENEVVVSTRLDRGRALVAIEDSGAGMADDARCQACDPFFSSRGAAGLGLYAAADAVARASGEMSISSVPGVGTRVEVRLPQVRPLSVASGREVATGEHPSVTLPSGARAPERAALDPVNDDDAALIGGRTLAGPG